MRATLAAALIAAVAISGCATVRSPSERAAFMRSSPCPATGLKRGACPGWEVDHIVPLKCGGKDRPVNMQWLTVAMHRSKTAAQARDCR